MSDPRTRQRLAQMAARLMYERAEKEYFTAKKKAAKALGVWDDSRPGDLPSNREIRDEIDALARLHEGEKRFENLREMRLEALRLMRKLERFRPRLIGSVLTGHIRKGSDIDIHAFSNSTLDVTDVLDGLGLVHHVENKRVVKRNEARVFTHIHVPGKFNIEITLYTEDKVSFPFRSSITGRPIEKVSLAELERLIRREYPELDVEAELERAEEHIDRFELYRMLLEPLERVKQDPRYHPEGDALYHSLQAFELARSADGKPYDEEFLLAALLHDVGKGIDPSDHVGAGVAALEGTITPRTEWLIAHHMEALELQRGELGHRAERRLRQSEDFEDLVLLREIDSAARRGGVIVCSVSEALEYIRGLEGEAYLASGQS